MTNESDIKLRACFASSPGLRRKLNEDSVLAEFPVFVVADGMGGHSAGDVASAMVVDGMRELVGKRGVTGDQVMSLLLDIQSAVTDLSDQTASGAGSTLSGVVVGQDADGSPAWLVINIGDSRTYRVLGDQIQRLTVDHSVVQEMVEAGRLSEAEAADHPQSNVITRALGDGVSAPDMWSTPIVPGERVLIVSDGALERVSDRDIVELLGEYPNSTRAARTLVELALANGGSDNITVVLIDIVGTPTTGTLPPLQPLRPPTAGMLMEFADDTTLPGERW